MNRLLKKEIRQLLPGLLLGLVSAAGCAVLPENLVDQATWVLLPLTALLLSLGAFGREFSAGTFSHLLAQPVERALVWRAKTAPLAFALGAIWVAWCALAYPHRSQLSWCLGPDGLYLHPWVFTGLAALAMYSGGLWTSLLFRHISAAFWMALLAPLAILATLQVFFWQSKALPALSALSVCVYSLAGILVAKRLFLRAQDAQWTGGSLKLPEIAMPFWGSGARRSWRPRLALLRKEIQLQKPQLIIAALLLVLNLLANAARTHCAFEKNSALKDLLGCVWCFWLALPYLIGATALGEERRLGTLGAQLCAPFLRREQFVWKTLAVLGLSLVLGCAMPLLLNRAEVDSGWPSSLARFLELSAQVPGVTSAPGVPEQFVLSLHETLFPFLPSIILGAVCVAVAGLSFFASTLSRNVLQAIGLALGAIMAGVFMVRWVYNPTDPFQHVYDHGIRLWLGPLIYFIAGPLLAMALAALAYWNYQRASIGRKEWLANFGLLGAALVVGGALTSLVYNRTWELLSPADRAQSGPRLIQGPVQMNLNMGEFLTIRLPDGRSWLNSYVVTRIPPFHSKAVQFPWFVQGRFLSGNNWQRMRTNGGILVGLQRDGSLWRSEPFYLNLNLPRPASERFFHLKPMKAPSGPWKDLHWNYLLKEDGTLWELVENWPGIMEVHRMGDRSDWAAIQSNGHLLNQKGEVWETQSDYRPAAHHSVADEIRLDSSTYAVKIPAENQAQWRESFPFWHWAGSFEIGIREDGSLKAIGRAFRFDSSRFRSSYVIDPVREFQVGTGNDWVSAVNNGQHFASIKADGTLWKWEFEPGAKSTPAQFVGKRMGERSDWVGIASAYCRWNSSSSLGFLALAADGSLWLWESPNNTEGNWLAPSRKPQYLDNIFDGPAPVGGLCEAAGGNRSVAITATLATLGGLTEATYRCRSTHQD